jgi:hypothetical protein
MYGPSPTAGGTSVRGPNSKKDVKFIDIRGNCLKPLHTRRRTHCVLKLRTQWGRDQNCQFLFFISRLVLRSWYVPGRFSLRLPRSHQVIITCTVMRTLGPQRLNCAFNTFLLSTLSPRIFHVLTALALYTNRYTAWECCFIHSSQRKSNMSQR